MGMSVGGGGDGPRSDINVTPLVDVVLVLLIIFMVVTPMLQKSKDVKLPEANKIDEAAKEEDPLTFAVTADKRVWLGQSPVSDDVITKTVKKTLKESPGKVIMVKGDRRLTVADVRRVMHTIQLAGAKKVALGVEQPTK